MEPTPSNSSASVTGLRAAAGGVEITACFENGASELVYVRKVPIRSMERYLLVINDEEKAIELFCNKEAGWAKDLTPESFTELIEKGEEINLPLFDAWHQRRNKRMERLSPGFKQKLESAIAEAARKSVSESLSKSSSSASPPATASP